MAIVTNSLGNNSVEIKYDAGEEINNIMNTFFDFIEQHGWELYDDSAGTNMKCYRARNIDNPTGDVDSWKYVVIDWNGDVIKLKTYEKWDTENHIGTNLAYYSDSNDFGQPINTSNGGSLYVFSHYRWLCLLSYIDGVYGASKGNSFVGVFEVERANPTDTWDASDPIAPVIWATGYYIGHAANSGNSYYFSFVRTKTGYTDKYACINTILSSIGIKMGRYLDDDVKTAVSGPNPWTGKNWVFNLIAGHGYPPYNVPVEFRGRIFGLKAVQIGLGSNMDTAVIECDSNYFWVDGGTATEHFVLTTPKLTFVIPK